MSDELYVRAGDVIFKRAGELHRTLDILTGSITGEYPHGLGAEQALFLPLLMHRQVAELGEAIEEYLDEHGAIRSGSYSPTRGDGDE